MSKERTSLDGTIVHTSTEIKTDEDIQDLYQTSTSEEPVGNFKNKSEKIRFALLILGIVLAMFMMSLNSTVVAPAMSIIATDLNALQSQTWIATAYLVAVNAFQPLSGKFSDVFGRKVVFMAGIVLFFVGSLVNALSTNINMLIAGRVVQGAGGSFVMSLCFIIVTDIAPVNLRPRFQSALAVVYGLASVVGPLIGGGFVDKASWHWDFWLNVIIAGLTFFLILFFLKEPTDNSDTSFIDKLKRIDWLGTLFTIGFIVCLLLAMNWGASSYGWSDAHSIGPFVAAGVSFIGLIIVEGWVAKEPILPGRVILNPSVTIVYAYMMCLGLTFIGTLYFGPIYYQAVFGADSTQSGLRLIPFMVCLIGGSVGGGFLVRKIPYVKYFVVIGACSNLLGYGLFYTVNENSTWGQQAGYLAFCGFAFGMSQQNCILTVQSSVEKRDLAVATSSCNFFMMLASSIGIAIYQALYSVFLKAQFMGLDPTVLATANQYGALQNFLYIRNMPAEIQAPVIHAYSAAIHNLFILPIGAAGLGVICTLFFKNVRYGELEATQIDDVASEDERNEKIQV